MSETTQPPLRVVCYGARHTSAQLPRIETGLVTTHGCVLVEASDTSADLIYANDAPRYAEAIEHHERAPGSRLILNVLDLAEHLLGQGYNPYDLLPQLRRAGAVTSTSRYVQGQLIRYFMMRSTVTYQPLKDVSPARRLAGERPFPEYRAMMVGRLRDPNKRAAMAIQALTMAGFAESEVAVVGESVGWGTHLGEVSDEVLNDLYNSVDYVMMPSLLEGLGLPALEGAACGAIPVITSDLSTFPEFYPQHAGCYPSAQAIAIRLRMLSENGPIRHAERQQLLAGSEDLRRQLSGAAVAGRILAVYHSLDSTPS